MKWHLGLVSIIIIVIVALGVVLRGMKVAGAREDAAVAEADSLRDRCWVLEKTKLIETREYEDRIAGLEQENTGLRLKLQMPLDSIDIFRVVDISPEGMRITAMRIARKDTAKYYDEDYEVMR